MICKYCHLDKHYIDKCPTIICKICKEIGHPQWLCKEKRKNKIIEKKNIEVIKKVLILEEPKNLNYFFKIKDIDWSDLIIN
jgi:hypothetical protein